MILLHRILVLLMGIYFILTFVLLNGSVINSKESLGERKFLIYYYFRNVKSCFLFLVKRKVQDQHTKLLSKISLFNEKISSSWNRIIQVFCFFRNPNKKSHSERKTPELFHPSRNMFFITVIEKAELKFFCLSLDLDPTCKKSMS